MPDVGVRPIEQRSAAQQKWEKLTHEIGRPGNESREAACIAMAEMLDDADRPAAKIFILQQLQRVGRGEVVEAIAKHLSHEKNSIRDAARRALANNPDPLATQPLMDRFEAATSVQEQRALLNAIGFRANPNSAEFLKQVINQTNGPLRPAATAALSSLAAVSGNVGVLRKGPDRDALLRAADQLLAAGKKREAFGVYQSVARNRDNMFGAAGYRGMLDSASGAELVDAVVAGLSHETKVRRQIATAKARTLGPDLLPQVAKQWKSLPEVGQVALLTAIGGQRSTTANSVVMEAITSNVNPVRHAALEALGSVGNASSVGLLVPLLNSSPEGVRLATNALQRMPTADVDTALTNELEKTTEEAVRVRLVEILNARRAVSALPTFKALLNDKSQTLRERVMSALSRLGQSSDVAVMLTATTKLSGPEKDRAEKNIVNMCRRLPDGAEPVVAYFEAADEEAKLAIMPLLGRIGDEAALTKIRESLNSSDMKRKDVAVTALSNWPNHEVASDLKGIAQSTKNNSQKIRALRSFGSRSSLGR